MTETNRASRAAATLRALVEANAEVNPGMVNGDLLDIADLLDGLTESRWTEYRLTDRIGNRRLTIQRGDRGCWSIDDACERMAPYHRPGDGFEVVEFVCSRLSGPIVSEAQRKA